MQIEMWFFPDLSRKAKMAKMRKEPELPKTLREKFEQYKTDACCFCLAHTCVYVQRLFVITQFKAHSRMLVMHLKNLCMFPSCRMPIGAVARPAYKQSGRKNVVVEILRFSICSHPNCPYSISPVCVVQVSRKHGLDFGGVPGGTFSDNWLGSPGCAQLLASGRIGHA